MLSNDRGVPSRTSPTVHEAYAIVRDGGGRENLQEDAPLGSWSSSFQVRKRAALNDLNENWILLDKRSGIYYTIDSVRNDPMAPRSRWVIYAIRGAPEEFEAPLPLGTTALTVGDDTLTVNDETVTIPGAS